MSHTDYIIIVLGGCSLLGIGVCVAIREVNRYARPVENVLTRRGDLELVDIIEPTRPQQIYNYPDLLTPEFTTYERISNRVQSYWSGDPPSYQTRIPSSYQTLPSYHTNINSCLENAINLDFILWFILFFMVILLIIYHLKSRVKRNNEKSKIVFTKGISSDIITFTEDYQDLLSSKITDGIGYHILYGKTDYYTLSYHWTLFDIKDWLDSLNEQDYAVTFHLTSVPSQELYYNSPKTILTNEFIINKSSNPVLISTLLYQQLEYFCNIFNSDYNENHFILIRYTVLTASP
jgi:hypothetical protein